MDRRGLIKHLPAAISVAVAAPLTGLITDPVPDMPGLPKPGSSVTVASIQAVVQHELWQAKYGSQRG